MNRHTLSSVWSRVKRSSSGLALLLGLAVSQWPDPASATALPEVKVSFVQDAPGFVFPMTEVEALAKEAVASRLGEAFGFIVWKTSESSDDSTSPAAEWTVILRQEEAGPGSRIWLEHHVQVGGPTFELPQNREHELLYELGNVIPFQSPNRLRDRVEQQLEDQLNGDFLDLVAAQFLRLIPLSHEVRAEADVDPPRLVVPLRLNEMKATSESMIGVRLKINNQQFGMFVLKASSQVVDGDLIGCVHGRIHEFEVPPIDDLVPPVWWHHSLPSVISRAQTTEVYMHDYDLDLAAGASTLGGIATEPDD